MILATTIDVSWEGIAIIVGIQLATLGSLWWIGRAMYEHVKDVKIHNNPEDPVVTEKMCATLHTQNFKEAAEARRCAEDEAKRLSGYIRDVESRHKETITEVKVSMEKGFAEMRGLVNGLVTAMVVKKKDSL